MRASRHLRKKAIPAFEAGLKGGVRYPVRREGGFARPPIDGKSAGKLSGVFRGIAKIHIDDRIRETHRRLKDQKLDEIADGARRGCFVVHPKSEQDAFRRLLCYRGGGSPVDPPPQSAGQPSRSNDDDNKTTTPSKSKTAAKSPINETQNQNTEVSRDRDPLTSMARDLFSTSEKNSTGGAPDMDKRMLVKYNKWLVMVALKDESIIFRVYVLRVMRV